MLAFTRTPSDCRYRRSGTGNLDSSVVCRLIQRLAGDASTGSCRVNDETCAACCRAAEPTESQPNEVVASLVHALCSEKLQAAKSAQEYVRVSENLVWVDQFLPIDAPRKYVMSRAKRRRALTAHNIWRRWFPRRTPRIGLVGWNNLKGLGHQNRDLARWLPVRRWLVPAAESASVKMRPAEQGTARIDYLLGVDNHWHFLRRWLHTLDVLLFVETPAIDGLTAVARRKGVRIACVPNWEWMHPGLDWLRDVDVMLCPTVYTQQLLEEWKRRFGFGWDVHYCPWPIDVAAFPFRLRTTCRRFVTVVGTDHRRPSRLDGTPTDTRRKGLEVLLAAARQLPHIPFLVWSQTDVVPPFPDNVELRMSPTSNADLYQEGDVCVQLSRWEGLGLPLLECQAAGMPLITLDAPPMNEHNPLAVVPVAESEILQLWSRRFIAAPWVRVEDVVAVLSAWFGRDIETASLAAREFVEREHSWSKSRSAILKLAACRVGRGYFGDPPH